MSEIKRVAVAGGTGDLGNAVLRALVEASYPVTVLSRAPGKLPAGLASHPSITEVVVDYTSPSSLQSALAGTDAVVSTLGNNTGESQKALVTAAEAAGVIRFLPSEFGSDLNNPIVHALPVFAQKVAVREFLEERVRAGSKLSYTLVFNNAFLDWGIEKRFLLDPVARTATLFDGGDYPISVARLSTVGQAVVGVLRHLEETKNRVVYVHDGRVSIKRLVDIIKEVSPGRDWTLTEASTAELEKKSRDALAKGIVDQWVWVGFIYRASVAEASGAGFERTDNELLGIKTLSDGELKTVVEEIVKSIPGAV